jgi:hypothetical protein
MVTHHDPITEAPPPGMLRRVMVYAIVALTVLLTVGLITATGIRWMKQPMPSSTIVVITGPSLVGGKVTVAREGEKPRPPVTIERRHSGQTPLFLESGSYTLRVEKDGRPVFRTDRPIYVGAGRIYDIDLATATTRPH